MRSFLIIEITRKILLICLTAENTMTIRWTKNATITPKSGDESSQHQNTGDNIEIGDRSN